MRAVVVCSAFDRRHSFMPSELICVIVPLGGRRGVCGTMVILPAIENVHHHAAHQVARNQSLE